jgi:hypothetical protein
MHTYRYIVTIRLDCSQCGNMNKEVIQDVMEAYLENLPHHVIVDEYEGEKSCS